MKASELIKELQKQINSVGDREVVWYNYMEGMLENVVHISTNLKYHPDNYIIISDGDYSYD
jgi:hypothetical protein